MSLNKCNLHIKYEKSSKISNTSRERSTKDTMLYSHGNQKYKVANSLLFPQDYRELFTRDFAVYLSWNL